MTLGKVMRFILALLCSFLVSRALAATPEQVCDDLTIEQCRIQTGCRVVDRRDPATRNVLAYCIPSGLAFAPMSCAELSGPIVGKTPCEFFNCIRQGDKCLDKVREVTPFPGKPAGDNKRDEPKVKPLPAEQRQPQSILKATKDELFS